VQRQTGNLAAARQNYEAAVAVDRTLAGREPNSLQRQRKVSTDMAKLIDVLMQLKEFAEARKSYADIFQSDARSVTLARAQYAQAESTSARDELVELLGTQSWHALLSSQPKDAADSANEALKLDPTKTWIKLNLGHAYLFLGQYDEAKTVYVAVKDVATATAGRTYAWYLKDDYGIFRRLQIGTPEMDRMEKELGV
jgi:tetratricopeptide (TPR) repeat protein